jgi:hypothetical protein
MSLSSLSRESGNPSLHHACGSQWIPAFAGNDRKKKFATRRPYVIAPHKGGGSENGVVPPGWIML